MAERTLVPISRRRAQERALVARARGGDRRALDELLTGLMPIAKALARRYSRSAHDCEDLEQVASMGLLKAIERFDPERGVMLATYATPIVAGEIKRYLRDHAWAIKVPRGAKDLAIRIETALPDLSASMGRSPTIAEISQRVDSSVEDVIEAMEARSAAAVSSLDQATDLDGESDAPFSTFLGVEDGGYAEAEARATLQPALRRLTTRERIVLELRFSDGLSQAEIGKQVGCSQMQVSRILRGALERAGSMAA
jgi:RNA polymerase sigma-B factor